MMNKRIYNLQIQNIILAEDEVHIWNFDLDKIIPLKNTIENILTDEELVRAGKFHFEIDKDRYICSRGLLRILLGIYTEIPSNQISFTFNEYGKPYLLIDQNSNGLHFNLSHSKNFMSVGFVKNAFIGVDVELMKTLKDHIEIAKRFFSANEFEQLISFPPEKLLNGFYSCWTAKEAVIKLSGEGLSFPLKEFDVELKDLKVGESYRYNVILRKRPENLSIEVFKLNDTLYGACAINKEIFNILHCNFDSEENSIIYLLDKQTH